MVRKAAAIFGSQKDEAKLTMRRAAFARTLAFKAKTVFIKFFFLDHLVPR